MHQYRPNMPERPGRSLQSRRANIYILVENNVMVDSETLTNINIAIGKWIRHIKDIIHNLNDEYFIRVLPVNDKSKWTSPAMNIQCFEWVDLALEGEAVPNTAFELLAEELEKCETDRWNYNRPAIVYFAASNTTCDCEKELKLLEDTLWSNSNRMAISVGTDANMDYLKKISDNNVIVTRKKFELILAELWNTSCVVPSILISNEDNHKRLVQVEIDRLYEGIFKIVDSTSILESQCIEKKVTYGLYGEGQNVVFAILRDYPNSWKDKKRFRALLLDYIPDNKLMQNLIIGCLENSIVTEVYKMLGTANMLTKVEVINLAKRLVNSYGCQIDYAVEIVNLWLDAFEIPREC